MEGTGKDVEVAKEAMKGERGSRGKGVGGVPVGPARRGLGVGSGPARGGKSLVKGGNLSARRLSVLSSACARGEETELGQEGRQCLPKNVNAQGLLCQGERDW